MAITPTFEVGEWVLSPDDLRRPKEQASASSRQPARDARPSRGGLRHLHARPRRAGGELEPGAQRIKGYAADEIIGEHFSRFYTDEERAPDSRAALRMAAENRALQRRRLAGPERWQPFLGDGGHRSDLRQTDKLVGFAKVTRDMTEQRAAQLAALKASAGSACWSRA